MNLKMDFRDLEAFERKLDRFPAEMEKETLAVVKQEARALAVDYGYSTLPFGFGENTEKFQQKIAAEVARVFPTMNNASKVYALLRRTKGEKVAGEWWAAFKAKDQTKMVAILRRRGVPRGVDKPRYEQERKGGQIPQGVEPVSLATEARQMAFEKKKQGRIGFAKGSWWQAAQAIGGRVRRNGREAFPKWVKNAVKGQTVGGAIVEPGENPRVTIYTRVDYMDVALPDRLKDAAEDYARERFRKSMEHRLRAMREKLFGR